MAKFYIYNTSNGAVLDLAYNNTNAIYYDFSGSPTQQWEFIPSVTNLGWTLKNAGTGTYLQPVEIPIQTKLFVVCSHNPVTWKFKSPTVIPLPNSLFTLEYGEFAMSVNDVIEQAILEPPAGQVTSGTQVWQLKSA